MTLDSFIADLNPDASDRPATALRLEVKDHKAEIPVHQRCKIQLVLGDMAR